MAKLVKKLAGLCYKVNELYFETREPERKKVLKEKFESLTELLEKAVRVQFDQNDSEYKSCVEQLKQSTKEIKALSKGLAQIEDAFLFLTDVIENIDTLLTDLKKI